MDPLTKAWLDSHGYAVSARVIRNAELSPGLEHELLRLLGDAFGVDEKLLWRVAIREPSDSNTSEGTEQMNTNEPLAERSK